MAGGKTLSLPRSPRAAREVTVQELLESNGVKVTVLVGMGVNKLAGPPDVVAAAIQRFELEAPAGVGLEPDGGAVALVVAEDPTMGVATPAQARDLLLDIDKRATDEPPAPAAPPPSPPEPETPAETEVGEILPPVVAQSEVTRAALFEAPEAPAPAETPAAPPLHVIVPDGTSAVEFYNRDGVLLSRFDLTARVAGSPDLFRYDPETGVAERVPDAPFVENVRTSLGMLRIATEQRIAEMEAALAGVRARPAPLAPAAPVVRVGAPVEAPAPVRVGTVEDIAPDSVVRPKAQPHGPVAGIQRVGAAPGQVVMMGGLGVVAEPGDSPLG